ncbi:MAG: BON domain-containing protein [Betaproteobacteria bacterium]|nr:MAG: BON domain-containing protein [Betaproteobacteria bacterium]
MAIITITRGQHSGGEEVAQAIADKIGARCVSLEVLREAARKYGVSEAKVEGALEKSPTFWERMTESRHIYVAYVQATLAEWAKDDNLVYHGNAGQELLRDVPHVLKVRLMYPLEARIQTIMQKLKYTREQAARYVDQIDDERTKRTRDLYNVDWRDSRRYDVTFNIDRLTSQHVIDIILGLVKQPEFTLTEAKAGAFNDFLIKTRVYALLAASLVGWLSRITITVHDGVVKLEGVLTSSENVVDEMVAEVLRLEGVKGVDNQIVVGLVTQEWNI